MRLRFTEPLLPQDRHALKPKVGETVLYEGIEYIVVEVGLRYAKVRGLTTSAVYLAKLQDLQKKIPPTDGVNPLMNYNP
jgi:hypothetical protein